MKEGLLNKCNKLLEELNELFERANTLWELGKAGTLGLSGVYVNCPSCHGGVLTLVGMDSERYASLDCSNCQAPITIDPNGFISLDE